MLIDIARYCLPNLILRTTSDSVRLETTRRFKKTRTRRVTSLEESRISGRFSSGARVLPPRRFAPLGRQATNRKSNVAARLKRGAHSRTTISRVSPRLGDARTPPDARTHRTRLRLRPFVPFVVDGDIASGLPPRYLCAAPFLSFSRCALFQRARFLCGTYYRSEDISDNLGTLALNAG